MIPTAGSSSDQHQLHRVLQLLEVLVLGDQRNTQADRSGRNKGIGQFHSAACAKVDRGGFDTGIKVNDPDRSHIGDDLRAFVCRVTMKAEYLDLGDEGGMDDRVFREAP